MLQREQQELKEGLAAKLLLIHLIKVLERVEHFKAPKGYDL
jgi:hypothetical protein